MLQRLDATQYKDADQEWIHTMVTGSDAGEAEDGSARCGSVSSWP